MRYVIELNYTSMIENKELCRYEMLKILRFCSGLNLIPTFKNLKLIKFPKHNE
jgi:hypothetical protein